MAFVLPAGAQTIAVWGSDNYGETNIPPYQGNAVAISAGGQYCLALLDDGSVIGWGRNNSGATTGTPTTSAPYTSGGPVIINGLPLKNIIAISAGEDHSLALTGSNTVVAWGGYPAPAGLSNVVAIATGSEHSMALTAAGKIVTWGQNGYGEMSIPTNLVGVKAISGAFGTSYVLFTNGTVSAYGYESYIPTYVTNVVAISSASDGYHCLGIRGDGSVIAWGYNSWYECNVPNNVSNVAAVAAGGYDSYALKSDGTIAKWGTYNYMGQLNIPAGISNVIALSANYPCCMALIGSPKQGPLITTQPQGQTVFSGNSCLLNVVVSGTPPINYQWQVNGQNIAGQTAASLSLSSVQFANAGGYLVVVTNAYGSSTSSVAQLTVFTNLALVQTTRTPQTTEIGNPTIPTDPTHFKVFKNGTFQSGVALDPTKMTVVLTHGWNGSPSDWAAYTAQIIQQRIGINTVNIVAWDWSADAQSDFLHLTEIAAKTPGEGQALGADLVAALGANYSQRIHFIGHSLGTLVNAAGANYVHSHGFSWANTQLTLCDEAEIASGVGANGLWQFTTTLPETAARLIQNTSTTEPYWGQALPNQFSWADNYISACGLLHPEAANAILNYTYPDPVGDMNTFLQEFYNFHDYAHYFYEDTIEPGIFNTGGQINATYMGFICSFEGGGIAQRPAANTVFYQNPNGLELNLAQTDWTSATSLLNARLNNFLGASVSSGINVALNTTGNAVGQVNGQIQSAGQNLENMVLNFFTSVSGGSLVQTSGAHPLGGPVPLGGSAGNTPAYAWIPLTIPSTAVSMSFDFMLQGNGNQDSFQAALQGTNILSVETSLIQTNVTFNSGLINVSQYAGTNVVLFLGIVGGTSTNAQLTVSDIQFYSVALPSLQAQVLNNKLIASWPLAAAGFTLQTSTNLTATNSWTTITNVPAIVNLQNAVTNPVSGGMRFYRLKQ